MSPGVATDRASFFGENWICQGSGHEIETCHGENWRCHGYGA